MLQGKLAGDADFARVNMQMQQTMQRLMGIHLSPGDHASGQAGR